jgi:hypothetical protein
MSISLSGSPANEPGAGALSLAVTQVYGSIQAPTVKTDVQTTASFAGGLWCIVDRSGHFRFCKNVKYTSKKPMRGLKARSRRFRFQVYDIYMLIGTSRPVRWSKKAVLGPPSRLKHGFDFRRVTSRADVSMLVANIAHA